MKLCTLILIFFSTLSFSFPEKETYKDQVLIKNGEGKRKYLFYTVYTAALYLKAKQKDGAKVLSSGTPKKIVMKYNHDISKKDMKKAWRKAITKNCFDKCKEVELQVSKFIEAEQGVKKEDLFEYTFLKDELIIVKNKNPFFNIKGNFFPSVLLSTWIGENPPTKSLKKSLLGK